MKRTSLYNRKQKAGAEQKAGAARPFCHLVVLLFGLFALLPLPSCAQRFFNLTADEVRVDTVLPLFSYSHDLGPRYADSTYTVSIEYPEFIPMSEGDVKRYNSLTDVPLKAMPEVSQFVSVSRRQGKLFVTFVPLVYRDGQYQKLVSFMLKVKGTALSKRAIRQQAKRRAATSDRYAANSVLSSGRWVKIRIPWSGYYQLTSELIRQAGFSDLDKVKIYGYGGAVQPEQLTGEYLEKTDDLKEVTTCAVNGKKVFYGEGPVTWTSAGIRVRNPYSNYGYYFLTENDAESRQMPSEAFLDNFYPQPCDYGSLYEVDDYSWYFGGRNLYDAQVLSYGKSYDYTLQSTGTTDSGTLVVTVSASQPCTVDVSLNGVLAGNVKVPNFQAHDVMHPGQQSFKVSNLQASNRVTLTPRTSEVTVRLDYISIYADQPQTAPDFSQTLPYPEIVHEITNQNLHANTAADMVIIIPASQKLRAQAERLKVIHSQLDGMRVQVIPADELYNEFSSGTPDVNAYRRYLKMLYDRAATEDDMPKYLLLLGDGAWDNRMVLNDWTKYSPDDFLLCYESENSYSTTDCYVSDDYFCMLDDNEGGQMLRNMTDVAVGRISAQTAEEATIAVDKIESYVNNQEAGAWQNLICFMGDDGNNNQHMDDADSVATMVEMLYPKFQVRRIMWDAYTRETSATGNSYPDVERLIKQQMLQGALIMNYSGHGRYDAVSHEYVLRLADFKTSTSLRLPLWTTASCDIMPFDGLEENIGETAMFNAKGGSIAFYGTTRTVFQNYNRMMNLVFTRHVLSRDDKGRPITIGEAVRQTKNELIARSLDTSANKLQYSLLGDPAVRLTIPTLDMEVQSINDVPMTEGTLLTLKAGSKATVKGRVLNADNTTDTGFNGSMTAIVRDIREKIVCRLNDTSSDGAQEPFVYYDRPNTIFSGSNSVKDGEFTFSFAVPKDIKYSDLTSLINLYAVNEAKTEMANGICEQLAMNGTEEAGHSSTGPDIYCYLNSPSFVNGGNVNTTPYFVAEINDEDGINASGSSIGHDLQIIIDGEMTKTYPLNDYFQFDFGSYTTGRVGYSIPELSYGPHKLQFRAWDVMNNSSTAELTFNVVKGLEPVFVDVECYPNPAKTSTSFRIIHDRINSLLDVKLEVFDTSGRLLWSRTESGVSTDNTYTVNWDLRIDSGSQLNTGLYLYRLSISSDGSVYTSKTKKLIVLTHK